MRGHQFRCGCQFRDRISAGVPYGRRPRSLSVDSPRDLLVVFAVALYSTAQGIDEAHWKLVDSHEDAAQNIRVWRFRSVEVCRPAWQRPR